MTIHAGPKIITNGLVLCLDPGNTKSYIGSGTTVADLSGNGNNATLQASPTFNTANLGSFSLNGTTQYLSTSYTQPSVEAYSIEAWFRTATVNNQMTFAQCRGGGLGNFHSDCIDDIRITRGVARSLTWWNGGKYPRA